MAVRPVAGRAACTLGAVGPAQPPEPARCHPARRPTRCPPEIPDGEDKPAVPAGRIACLDDLSLEGYQRKGVQKRDFLKRMKFEISGVGGFYASDVLSSTYTAGGALALLPGRGPGPGAAGQLVARCASGWSSRSPRSIAPGASSPGSALQAMGGLLFSPFHAKFKVTEQTILHGDLFAVAGAGRTFHDSVQGVTFQGGLGLRLYLMKRLSFRLDVRDFVLPQEVLGAGARHPQPDRAGGLRDMARVDGARRWRWCCCWRLPAARARPAPTTSRTPRSAWTPT